MDTFDRKLGSLDGLPDTLKTRPTTIRDVTALVGEAQTFIVQTIRQRDQGDTIFLEHVSEKGTSRFVIPPKVADLIAAQRMALTDRARVRSAKQAAATRKERGIAPAFLKRRSG